MKKPNPIFLGLIATAVLLPHAPRLLPQDQPQPVTVQQSLQAPAYPLAAPAGLPAAEIPPAPADRSRCSRAGADFPECGRAASPPESGIDRMVPVGPATTTGAGCDTDWNLSQTSIRPPMTIQIPLRAT